MVTIGNTWTVSSPWLMRLRGDDNDIGPDRAFGRLKSPPTKAETVSPPSRLGFFKRRWRRGWGLLRTT